MTSTRKHVLKTLLTRQRCTINELADIVGINPISVRHHISKLEADRLVTSEEERHGVGRPHRIYFLTEKGMEQFPTRYLQLTVRLLEQLKESMPEPMVGKLFSQMATEMAEDYTSEADIDHLNTEERLDLLKNLLAEEGFIVEWEQRGDQYHIREVSCPYYHVGQSHPEVCSVDQTLISTVLSVPVEKVKCILNGDSFCTYIVPNPEKTEVSKAEN